MRCDRCQFENMPGQARCIRCGSILEPADATVEVHPPRMPGWQKPVRETLRWLRGRRLSPERWPGTGLGRSLERIAAAGVAGQFLGVVPGLAHLAAGRFHQVRLPVALWCLCLAAGLFLYGSRIGSLLIGLAIGVHAWIIIQQEGFRKATDLATRAALIVVVVAFLTILYRVTPRVMAPGVSGGYATFTIPALHVQAGDYLLTRRVRNEERSLARGTLVRLPSTTLRNGRPDILARPGVVLGQIVGLPGETIRLEGKAYAIGPQQLDPDRFPVPAWLLRSGSSFAVRIPPDSYFVSLAYAGNARLETALIRQACIIPASEIRGRAFLLWSPLARRGFIE